MSIMNDIRKTMESSSGLSEMIDAAIDTFDPDESCDGLDIQVYGALDTDDQEEIDSDVGEDDDPDIDDFLDRDEQDAPPEIITDSKPLTDDEPGGIRMSSDDSGEIDSDVGEEFDADVDDVLESLLESLHSDLDCEEDEDDNEEDDSGIDILTGNYNEDDDYIDIPDNDEELEDIEECDM